MLTTTSIAIRNAMLAFDREFLCFIVHINIYLTTFLSYTCTAKNNEVVATGMKKLRAIISYFDSSTQAM